MTKKVSLLGAWAVLGFLVWLFGMNILFFLAGCVFAVASGIKALHWGILAILGKTKWGRIEKFFDWLSKGGERKQ